MIKYENQCVDCGLPCVYEACRYYNVPIHYCDECGSECTTFVIDEEELCEDCTRNLLQKMFEDLSTEEQVDLLKIKLKKYD